MSRSEFVAVIPAFRCARTVGAVAAGARRHVARVVVVDDGSDDDTSGAARSADAEVLRLERNRGKGFALRSGIDLALRESPAAVILLDADGQHDPEDLPGFLRAWDESRPDLIVGCRLQEREVIPPARFWTNYIGSRVLSWMTGMELHDSQSGYRMLATGLLRRMRFRSDGYAIESEMLIKAGRLGARVAHVRVRTIYNGGGSHFRPVTDTFRISCASVYFKVFDDGDGGS